MLKINELFKQTRYGLGMKKAFTLIEISILQSLVSRTHGFTDIGKAIAGEAFDEALVDLAH